MKNRDNLKIRRVNVEVKGKDIEYDEYYLVDSDGNEVFDRDIEIKNDARLYNIYKMQNNLLTSEEIKKIRNKYCLTQKEYALVIGVGEVTVHRFEKYAIQTEAVDAIMRLSADPDNMAFLLLQNKKNISLDLYNDLSQKIKELQVLKKHAVIDPSKFDVESLKFKEENVLDVAKNIIKIYNDKVDELVKNYDIIPEYITNLKLQKLLYYVQSISLLIFEKKAFSEKILAWAYGPVVKEVYQRYKGNQANQIVLKDEVKDISSGLYKVVDEVVKNYGVIEANKLIDFTHEEDPWKNTLLNEEISVSLIKEYFDKVYNS